MENTKTILIADDEKALSGALKIKFTKEGFNVLVANNGEEAIKLLGENQVDFMVLDLIMPVMDGFEVIEKMNEMGKKVPLVVVSNLGQKEDIDKLGEMGVTNYFVKSDVPISQVVEFIRKQIGN